MSTPPASDQPSTNYAYPHPGSVGGYGQPVPPQGNPYAQPTPGFGGPVPPVPTVPPTGGGGGGGGGGRAGKAALWAVVGAVVASAAWAGWAFLLDKKDDDAKVDTRGYQVQSDACAATDISSFKEHYPQTDSRPTGTTKYTAKSDALDVMYCSQGLEVTGSNYADATVTVQASIHKKSDPAPEFAATWQTAAQRDSKIKVTKVDGYGDEAYLTTEDNFNTTGGWRSVTLGVRDGALTYQVSWYSYISTIKDRTPPTVEDGTKWVEATAKTSMPKLKS